MNLSKKITKYCKVYTNVQMFDKCCFGGVMKNIDLQYISQKLFKQLFYPQKLGRSLGGSGDYGNFTYSKVLFFDIKASIRTQQSEQAYRSYLSLIWTFLNPPQSDFDVETDKWMLAVESDISVTSPTVLMTSNALIIFKPQTICCAFLGKNDSLSCSGGPLEDVILGSLCVRERERECVCENRIKNQLILKCSFIFRQQHTIFIIYLLFI